MSTDVKDIYYILCPKCPGSLEEAAPTLSKAIKVAKAKQVDHIKCAGEVWIYYPLALKGEAHLWDVRMKAFGWKDVEPKPVHIHYKGKQVRLRFPVTGQVIMEVLSNNQWHEVETIGTPWGEMPA